jgi:sulfate permease, SulP family
MLNVAGEAGHSAERAGVPHALSSTRPPGGWSVQTLATEAIAGFLAAVVLVAFSVSYAVMIFQGEMVSAIPTALWAILMGGTVTGLMCALRTSIAPVAFGFDTVAAAMCVMLATSIAATTRNAGYPAESAQMLVLLAMSATTVLIGATLVTLAHFRLSTVCRLIPFSVVCGFNAATGLMLMLNGFKLASGKPLSLDALTGLTRSPQAPVIVFALGVALSLYTARALFRRSSGGAGATGSALVIPVVLGLASLAGAWVTRGGTGAGVWYVTGVAVLTPWTPLATLAHGDIDWGILARFAPDMLAIAVVTIGGLAVKIASGEQARGTIADLDAEFSATGWSNLIAVPLGGFAASVLNGPTRVLTEAGSVTRYSGLVCSLVVGCAVLFKIDILRATPLPVLAGLVMFVGHTFLVDALRRFHAQRQWLDFSLATGIAVTSVVAGYLVGIILGLIAACFIFAYNYGRIGVVRQMLTRSTTASPIQRGPDATRLLTRDGDAIHLYALSGYIFFGSSDGLINRIAAAVEAQSPRPVRFVILDFTQVTGMDSSAIMSLGKLRIKARKADFTPVYVGLSPAISNALTAEGIIGTTTGAHAHATRAEGMAWCEDELLSSAGQGPHQRATTAAFEAWLARELGRPDAPALLDPFLIVRTFEAGDVLYNQGDQADTIDLVCSGTVSIKLAVEGTAGDRVAGDGATSRLIRQMTYHTVVGEMGFFRDMIRTAAVVAEDSVVVYTLTRANFERLQTEQPDIAMAFLRFIARMLADRLEFANRETAALI